MPFRKLKFVHKYENILMLKHISFCTDPLIYICISCTRTLCNTYIYKKGFERVLNNIYKYKEEKRYSEKLIFKKHAFVSSLNLLFFLILYKNLRRIYSSSPPPLLSFFLFLRPGRPSAPNGLVIAKSICFSLSTRTINDAEFAICLPTRI